MNLILRIVQFIYLLKESFNKRRIQFDKQRQINCGPLIFLDSIQIDLSFFASNATVHTVPNTVRQIVTEIIQIQLGRTISVHNQGFRTGFGVFEIIRFRTFFVFNRFDFNVLYKINLPKLICECC